MRTRPVAPACVLVVACFGGLASCQWSATTFSGIIRVAPGVAPAQAGAILLLINDDIRYPATEGGIGTDGQDSWSPSTDGPHVVVPSGRMSGTSASYDQLLYEPGRLEYFYWHSEMQYPATQVYLGAFVDLNDNRQLDPSEPWGTCRGNPLLDPVDDTSDKAPNQADIQIDQAPAESSPDQPGE